MIKCNLSFESKRSKKFKHCFLNNSYFTDLNFKQLHLAAKEHVKFNRRLTEVEQSIMTIDQPNGWLVFCTKYRFKPDECKGLGFGVGYCYCPTPEED